MRPNAVEILRSIGATFDEYLLPEISEPFARSLALTISNLLRHVTLRVEQEGGMLAAEITDLRDVLGLTASFASSAGLDEVAAEIRTACEHEPAAIAFVEMSELEDEAMALQWALQHAIRAFDTRRDELAGRDGYQEVRRAIRQYLRRSLEREGTLIVPAFTGERR